MPPAEKQANTKHAQHFAESEQKQAAPDLAAVAAAWPSLAEPIKAAIIALVNAASG